MNTRRIAAGVTGIVLALTGAFGLAGCESNYPEGVDTDSYEVRSVTMSGDNYEVLDYNDDLYELPSDSTEVVVLEDSGREFMSRNRDKLWIKTDTAERLGIEDADSAE